LIRVCGNVIQGNWFVRDGRCVKFWSDWWMDNKVLKDKFPRLYSISLNKESLVGDVAEWDGRRTSRCTTWNLSWRRERFEWEKHLEEQMLTLISNVKWDVRREDRLVWVGEVTQEYTVRFGYNILIGESFMQSLVSFKLLWSLSVAPSAIVGVWRILLDKLPTRLNLAGRGVSWQIRFVLCAKMVLNPLIICLILVLWYNKCGTSATCGLERWVVDIRPLMSIFRVFAYWAKSRALIEPGKGCG